MQLQQVHRAAEALQQPVTTEELLSICERAFGSTSRITAIHEIAGGTINNTYWLWREMEEIVAFLQTAV